MYTQYTVQHQNILTHYSMCAPEGCGEGCDFASHEGGFRTASSTVKRTVPSIAENSEEQCQAHY